MWARMECTIAVLVANLRSNARDLGRRPRAIGIVGIEGRAVVSRWVVPAGDLVLHVPAEVVQGKITEVDMVHEEGCRCGCPRSTGSAG